MNPFIYLFLFSLLMALDIHPFMRSDIMLCACVRLMQELIEYYKHHSLREGFRTLDTTLQFAYREPENGANSTSCAQTFMQTRLANNKMYALFNLSLSINNDSCLKVQNM